VKFLIVGTVRNVEKTVRNEIIGMQRLFSKFGETHFHLVESDSSDSTIATLRVLENEVENFTFHTFGKLDERIPNRVNRIRYCRNNYVKYIRESDVLYDFVVVCDWDGINRVVRHQSLNKIFRSESVWSMCSANQTFGYYDIYALRAKAWVETDFITELSDFKKKHGPLTFWQEDRARKKIIYKKMKILRKSTDWIEVESAFGGMAIYKANVFQEFDYGNQNTIEELECEHITLHRKMNEAGMKIYVCPEFINSHINIYNLNKITLLRVLRHLKRKALSL